MSVRFPGLLAGLVLLIGCSACTIARPPAELFDDLQEASDVDPSFWPGMQHLAPLSEGAEDSSQEALDCVLLGVKISHDGQESIWFVRLSSSAAEPEPSPHGMRLAPFALPMDVGSLSTKMKLIAPAEKVWVETYDHQGALVQSSIRSVPTGISPSSVLELCQYMHDHSTSAATVGEAAVNRESLAALLIKLNAIGSSRSLRPIHEVVKKDVLRVPGVLEMVAAGFKRRMQLMVHQSQWQARPLMGLLGHVPSGEMRFQLRYGGQAIFNGRLLCRTPEAPFHLTGGLLMLEAVHPDKPQNRLTLRVLAAKHR